VGGGQQKAQSIAAICSAKGLFFFLISSHPPSLPFTSLPSLSLSLFLFFSLFCFLETRTCYVAQGGFKQSSCFSLLRAGYTGMPLMPSKKKLFYFIYLFFLRQGLAL
jgi:hypothetical protein